MTGIIAHAAIADNIYFFIAVVFLEFTIDSGDTMPKHYLSGCGLSPIELM